MAEFLDVPYLIRNGDVLKPTRIETLFLEKAAMYYYHNC